MGYDDERAAGRGATGEAVGGTGRAMGRGVGAGERDPGLDDAVGSGSIEVRALSTHADLEACVVLQRAVWGEGYRDSVPSSLLKVAQRVGGLAAGAFEGGGEMVGFVFGLTGMDGAGRVIHWSHMLGVSRDWRDRGIGLRLKLYQRRVLAERGVERACWTFDPLVARNAHLNVNRLGARLVEYVPEMYADTGSALHAFGMDRFVVEWPVAGALVLPDGAGGDASALPIWNRAPGGVRAAGAVPGGKVRVEIPGDLEALRAAAPADVRDWRTSTRAAFVQLMDRGYRVVAFYRDGSRCFYVLEPGD